MYKFFEVFQMLDCVTTIKRLSFTSYEHTELTKAYLYDIIYSFFHIHSPNVIMSTAKYEFLHNDSASCGASMRSQTRS